MRKSVSSFGRFAILAIVSAAVVPVSAAAQDMGAFNDAGRIMVDTAGNAAVGRAIADSVKSRGSLKSRDPSRRSSASAASASGIDAKAHDSRRQLAFARNPRVTEQVRTVLIAKMRASNPEYAARFDAQTRAPGFRGRLASAVAGKGLDDRNLADVAAYLVGLNWAVVHASDTPRTDAFVALRDQVRPSMEAQIRAQHLSDSQKQFVADDMLFRAYMLTDAVTRARAQGDGETMQALARGARTSIRETMGIDLGAYRLTQAGLQSNEH